MLNFMTSGVGRAREVEDRAAVTAVDGDRKPDGRPVVHLVLRDHGAHLRQAALSAEPAQHLPHRLLRVLLRHSCRAVTSN